MRTIAIMISAIAVLATPANAGEWTSTGPNGGRYDFVYKGGDSLCSVDVVVDITEEGVYADFSFRVETTTVPPGYTFTPTIHGPEGWAVMEPFASVDETAPFVSCLTAFTELANSAALNALVPGEKLRAADSFGEVYADALAAATFYAESGRN